VAEGRTARRASRTTPRVEVGQCGARRGDEAQGVERVGEGRRNDKRGGWWRCITGRGRVVAPHNRTVG
jgi:hypothetical protein